VNVDELRAELARYTYKPGWRLTIAPHTGFGAVLHVGYDAPDSRTPGETARIESRHVIDPWDAEHLAEFVAQALRQAEMHELAEWLRYDGVMVDDPHAERPKTSVWARW